MKNEIGTLAGTVWSLLSEKGPLTITQLKTATKGTDFLVAAAVGWLAREDKVGFEKTGKTIKIKLL